MRGRRLLQQYAVDQWAKIMNSRLQWVRQNQKSIRAEKYRGLLDAVQAGDTNNPGRKLILPPTIYGSPRFYSEAFQNAMAIVRHLGKPDFFITFTTNPKWPEIQAELHEGEKTQDRPDLCARVFKMKYDALLKDLLKQHVMGKVQAHTATIEWQKRGLTHAHILLIMQPDDKPKSPEKIDTVVSAELPDSLSNPQLHKVITANNIHGPCGSVNMHSPCMNGTGMERKCSKNFPKDYIDATTVTDDSYPKYKRRSPTQGGHTHTLQIHGEEYTVDNSFVVPYNPYLSLRYSAHINVEVVHSIQAVKYLYKYITKGQDRVMLQLTDWTTVHDEIETYLNARYISASEAFWRIYNFPLHQKYPPVEKLPCHLPGEQVVLFEPNAAANTVQNGPPITKLTAFFTTNATDKEAKNITYPDFPRYFTWNASKKAWQRRKRGTSLDQHHQFVADTIGRIPTIALTPHQSELYYLRMLLHHKPGPCSYEDIRTIDDTLCPTFQDTCNKLGLISDDNEINLAMTEASSIKFGNQLRYFFTTLLMYCRPADPPAFWAKWQVELSQDFLHRDKLQIPNDAILNEVLLYLQRILDQDNLDLNRDFNLPSPDLSLLQTATTPRVIQEETDFDTTSLTESLPMQISSLNNDQQVVYQAILESVNNNSGKMFCLNASGGTGKTYVLNILLNTVRANKDIALATALSECKAMIPGLTVYRIDQARKHAKDIGGGQPVSVGPIEKSRLDDVKVDHFLDFDSQPEFLQDVAYGTKTIKLSHGEKLEIPNVVRSVISSRIIDLYLGYCEETGFSSLKRSSLFSIIQVCAASQKKSLAGLDNVVSEGTDAFETLHETINTLGECGHSSSWIEDKKRRLDKAKLYLKSDYKMNVHTSSRCGDHCIPFALGGQSQCDHVHDLCCDQCEDMKSVLEEI
ncbi:uncharacterized protein LOC135489918 [Lineus longissimus]|uniref:uncharacterized protein LOC135489918 n=1 Tax=Lineus longissimus TaxID=88925 RepID=UPI00315DA5A6